MISGAEARRFGRALESVSTWVSEIDFILNAGVADGIEAVMCLTRYAKTGEAITLVSAASLP